MSGRSLPPAVFIDGVCLHDCYRWSREQNESQSCDTRRRADLHGSGTSWWGRVHLQGPEHSWRAHSTGFPHRSKYVFGFVGLSCVLREQKLTQLVYFVFGWPYCHFPLVRVEPKRPRHAAPSPGQPPKCQSPRRWDLEVVLPGIRIAHTQAHLAEIRRTNPSTGETRLDDSHRLRLYLHSAVPELYLALSVTPVPMVLHHTVSVYMTVSVFWPFTSIFPPCVCLLLPFVLFLFFLIPPCSDILLRPFPLTVFISLKATVSMCYRDVLRSCRSVHLSAVCLFCLVVHIILSSTHLVVTHCRLNAWSNVSLIHTL